MKKNLLILTFIIFAVISPVRAMFLISEVYSGDRIAVIGVYTDEYCNVQRGCAPSGYPTYVFYNGSGFKLAPPWFGSYSILGTINDSLILQRSAERYEIVLYNPFNGSIKRIYTKKPREGEIIWGLAFINGSIYVSVREDYREAHLCRISLNGSPTFLGKVKGLVDGIAFRDYIFIRTKPVSKHYYYHYYILLNDSARWLASGNIWLDYFNGTLLIIRWGNYTINRTLLSMFKLKLIETKSFSMSLGWNGTWYIYHDTSLALTDALYSGEPISLYSENGSFLGHYYLSSPGEGFSYIATRENPIKLEGLTWYVDSYTGEWLFLSGYESFGWPVAFTDSSLYLYAGGDLYIWNLSDGGKRVVRISKENLPLKIVSSKDFVLLYFGRMYSNGGSFNALYAYNGTVIDLVPKLHSLFPNPPEKVVDVVHSLSNGTSVLIYVEEPESEPWECGHLYEFNGTFRYIGRYYPLSWAGIWIVEDDKGLLYTFNGSCIKPLNITGEVAGSYILSGKFRENRTLYVYKEGVKKIATFPPGSHITSASSGVLVVTENESYIVQGFNVYRIPLKLDLRSDVSVNCFKRRCLIAYVRKSDRSRKGEFNLPEFTSTLYILNDEFKKVGEFKGMARVLGHSSSGWVIEVDHWREPSSFYLYNGEFKEILRTEMYRTEAFLIGDYLILSNQSFETYPRQFVYRVNNGTLEFLGIYPSEGTSYLAWNGTLIIGGEGSFWDVIANKSFQVNGTVKGILPWRGGVLVQTDYAIYVYNYKNGEIIQYIPPESPREGGVKECPKENPNKYQPPKTTSSQIEPKTPLRNTPRGLDFMVILVLAIIVIILGRRK
ncbi:hypothetical protein [Pyrococcus kukulkanii]|uniref:hypothetical protein n=1 Tax=Pyrococcus kukulkanii TaxID=1609559 RepID=UPI003567A81A